MRPTRLQLPHIGPDALARTASDYAHIATARNRRRSKVACSATLDLQPAALPKSSICVSVTATTVESFIHEIEEVERAGADIVELRLDFIKDFDTERDLARIMASCSRPYIVTFRPQWEGGQYTGPEPPRLATLKLAALRGAPHVDVEFKAAPLFFASRGEVPVSCKVILSFHNFATTPSGPQLQQLAADMHAAGADIVKIATMAQDISDTATVLALLDNPPVPTIALAMGERGLLTRILAAKYGAYLTFAALAPGRESAPGQPNLQQLRQLFNFQAQQRSTKLFGIIGNPVSHSRSPLIHNTAFQHCGFDGVYVPLLVDDLPRFLAAFEHHTDFQGFSVTIPHKEAALQVCQEVDPVAAQIGAVNTLVRLAGGGFKGYNTDWLAAIEAIEHQLAAGSPPHPEQPHQPLPSPSATSSPSPGSPPPSPSSSSSSAAASPLQHKTVLVLGAGGAGRALAFGAASRGARVLVANRNRDRAEQLVASMTPGTAQVVEWSELQAGQVQADVLANTTAVGMAPQVAASPVPASSLSCFGLVFDAVYTPVWTQLLLDAKAANCQVVDGLQMFVGQAVRQFELFTGLPAPSQLMADTLVKALGQPVAVSPK
ncbi:dehydroquinate dehydratase [Haematococcus lacustris]